MSDGIIAEKTFVLAMNDWNIPQEADTGLMWTPPTALTFVLEGHAVMTLGPCDPNNPPDLVVDYGTHKRVLGKSVPLTPLVKDDKSYCQTLVSARSQEKAELALRDGTWPQNDYLPFFVLPIILVSVAGGYLLRMTLNRLGCFI